MRFKKCTNSLKTVVSVTSFNYFENFSEFLGGLFLGESLVDIYDILGAESNLENACYSFDF